MAWVVSEVAYAAGFFDGEGCVRLNCSGGSWGKRSVGYTLQVSMTQLTSSASRDLFQEIHAYFGGSFSEAPSSVKRRSLIHWSGGGATAFTFLMTLRPYLRIKRDQTDLALGWYLALKQARESYPGGHLPRNLVGEWQLKSETIARRLTSMKRGYKVLPDQMGKAGLRIFHEDETEYALA